MTAKPVLSVLGPGLIPARAGIGLRAEHYDAVLQTRPAVGWLEVHSENYFGAGGKPLDYLERIRPHYPLSLHGLACRSDQPTRSTTDTWLRSRR